MPTYCKEKDCKKQALFNFKEKSKPKYCGSHRIDKMINVMSKKCKETGCYKQPVYNYIGETSGKYCFNHRKDEMINIRNKRCEHSKCNKRALFNYNNKIKPIYCGQHRLKDMVNIRGKKCAINRCNKRPIFNYKSEKSGLYCKDHHLQGMINLESSRCIIEGCNTIPSFGEKGTKKRLYCQKHAPLLMVNIDSRQCEQKDCAKQPVFNYKTEKAGRFCSKHALLDMINVKKKRCNIEDCNTGVLYGLPGHKPTKCGQHKDEGMIKQSNKRCITNDCRNIALYGINKQKHCELHKRKNEINLIEKRCKKCNLLEIVNAKQICRYCDPELNKKFILAKQKEVKHYLDVNGFNYVSTDRIIDNGTCGRERPDFLFDAGTHYIIIEVDEHQHKGRPCECEQTRMVNISQSLGLTTIFIRYNPDEFKVDNKKKSVSINNRLKVLGEWLNHLLNIETNEIPGFLSVVYLFFDEYNKEDTGLQTVLPNFNKPKKTIKRKKKVKRKIAQII